MRFLFWKSFFGLLAYDVLLPRQQFAGVHRLVRDWPVRRTEVTGDTIQSVCDAVNHALMWYPKRVMCLQRAAVTTCLLRNQGVPARMILGAQKYPFRAHAWVEVDGRPVNETNNDVQLRYGVWEKC
jgi:hypothetical protein